MDNLCSLIHKDISFFERGHDSFSGDVVISDAQSSHSSYLEPEMDPTLPLTWKKPCKRQMQSNYMLYQVTLKLT